MAQTDSGKYASINGIQMCYEMHGAGTPLVLIHGGGSTIKTTFGIILPCLQNTPGNCSWITSTRAYFKDWEEKEIAAIQMQALIAIGGQDLPKPQRAVEMAGLLPNGRLAVLPGNHGNYMGKAMSAGIKSKVPGLFVALVDEFLAKA